MGLTASRLHVRATEPEEFGRVADVLRGGPSAIGVDSPAPLPLRGLVVCRPGSSRWVTVADSPWDQYLFDSKVRRAIAGAVGGIVIATEVYDSDYAAVTLIRGGRSNRALRLPVSDKLAESAYTAWRNLWRPGVEVSDVVAAMRGPRSFAEDYVVDVLDLVGIGVDLAVGALEDDGDTGLIRLAAWERPPEEPPVERAGPPALSVGGQPTLVGLKGHEFSHLVRIYNPGGRGAGLHVTVSGPAIDNGIITINEIGSGADEDHRTVPWSGTSVELEVDVPPSDIGSAPLLTLRGHALLVGRGALDVELAPIEANAAKTVGAVRVLVLGDDDIPLGSTDPMLLAQCGILVDPRHLLGCYALDPYAATPELILDIFERFLTAPGLLEADEGLSVASVGSSKGIGIKNVLAREIGTTKRWARLGGVLDGLPDLWVRSLGVTGTMLRRESRARPGREPMEEPVRILLSINLDRYSPEQIAPIVEELVRLGDDLLQNGALVQGFSDRWTHEGILAANSYMRATTWHARQQAGTWVDSLSWCRRYLNAVASTTWLGHDLANRAQLNTPHIEDLTTIMTGGLRIDAPTGAQRRRVEAALADIVPGLAPIETRFLESTAT